MKFFAIAAFAAVAVAQYPVAEDSCSIVTVTVTQTMRHTPSAPTSHAATGPAPYPTSGAVRLTMSMGTGVPTAPVQTPLVSVKPTVSMKPSGTGAFSAPPTQFTGAASHIKVGGALAAGAMAALFL